LGCCTTRQDAPPSSGFAAARSSVPSAFRGATAIVRPVAPRYVLVTARKCGCTVCAITTECRSFFTPPARIAASAQALAPSYIEALATSIPDSSHIIVWNS
jgi:hypothetical protein